MSVSAMVQNWMMVVRTVVSSLRAHADVVAAALERELFPDDPRDRVKTIILARADELERKLTILEARDRAVAHERGDNASVAKELAEAIAATRERIIKLRSLVAGIYDDSVLALLGLTGETPTDDDALRQYAATVREALAGDVLPTAPDQGGSVDVARQLELLDAAIARLAAASKAEAADVREDQGAVNARNDAEAELRRAYIAAADGFAADATRAGRPDIADRVRPTSRRRKGLPEPIDLDPEAGGDEERERELVTGDTDA